MRDSSILVRFYLLNVSEVIQAFDGGRSRRLTNVEGLRKLSHGRIVKLGNLRNVGQERLGDILLGSKIDRLRPLREDELYDFR